MGVEMVADMASYQVLSFGKPTRPLFVVQTHHGVDVTVEVGGEIYRVNVQARVESYCAERQPSGDVITEGFLSCGKVPRS